MPTPDRVAELFQEAIGREPGSDRDAWLREAAGDDAALLERVQRLLEAHAAVEADGDSLAGLGRGLLRGEAACLVRWAEEGSGPAFGIREPDRSWEPEPGDHVGRYQIQELLGRGGMGTVFLALDPVLNRQVALKFISSELRGEERLLDEARAASALDHPCIGTVYEVGHDDHGRSFIAMAWYEGGTLRDRLREGPLPVDEAVRVAVQVADALDAAHRAGIIHRDVKPENLVLDGTGRVKVVDFGIALAEHGRRGSVSRGGTPAYMSPEELAGAPADGRSDLWALGVVLYEMLAGRHPFHGPDRAAVVSAIEAGRAPSVSDLRPEVDSGLAEVVRRMLDRDPDARIQTGRELARRLRAAVEPAPGIVDLLRGPRGRAMAWSAAGVVVVVFAAGVMAARQGPRLVEARGHADDRFQPMGEVIVADFNASEGLGELALATREALVIDLQQSGFVRVASRRRTASFLERMGLAADSPVQGEVALEVAQRAGAGAVIEVTVARAGPRYVLGGRALESDTGDELFSARVTAGERGLIQGVERLSREMRQRLGETAASLAESHPLPDVTTPSLEALRLYAEAERVYGDDPSRAVRLLGQAVEIDPGFAMAHRLAGAAATNSLDFARVGEHTRRAFEHQDRLTDQERWHIQAIHASEGAMDPWLGLDYYERILARFPEDFRAHWNLGLIRMSWFDDWEGARQSLSRALEINPDMGHFSVTAALVSLALGHHEEAGEFVRRARERGFEEYAVRFDMVRAFAHGDFEGVDGICTSLLASRAAVPLPADDREFCGSAYVGMDRPELAVEMLEGALEGYRDAGRLRSLAHTGQTLVTAHLIRGDTATARAWLERTADAIAPEGFPDPDRYLTRVNLATQAGLFGWTDLAEHVRARYPPHPDPDHWFGHAGEALVDAALAVAAGDGDGALARLDAGFPPGVMPVGWRTFDELLRGRAHELRGDWTAARHHYERAGSRSMAVKAFQTKDRMNIPLALEGLARVEARMAEG